jgi:DNA-binding CsgD family transcriptional regulator
METKVTKLNHSPIPAGMFSGIEAFWYAGEKWVIAHGVTYRYNEAPTVVKSIIQKAFMHDKQSLAYMAKMGLRKANEIFDTWYRCVVGGLDHVPDFAQKFTPDAYNNMCDNMQCPHRGRLCGRASAIKNYEVETIAMLERGESMEQTAQHLFITQRGIKSRVEKLKEKLDCPNMAALMCKTAQLGIF